jgi:glutathione peroxidase
VETLVNLDYRTPLARLDGTPDSLSTYQGQVLLIVNTASQCGKTPQYEGLQSLFDAYASRGFTILGFPCNQFNEEEPGSWSEIAEFCTVNYGITFPLFEKTEVNGSDRHPLYAALCAAVDAEGEAGDIQWNFEKFLVDRRGQVRRRFRPAIVPDASDVVAAIEAALDE